eukprot:CAMPEP_0205806046 /NCGR_PEP_ID=MMETSP0205-20121125/9445_1 /ASSEMBLY_ACC=CAM_ASM_000278 /TAXON_ID=36767 /ORGANISM="Euplotes focardii, Strain TN1" /LENGTH=50 /DNA_ID=CAMNT_0053078223 /DNA_START=688 /DNA_END=840 /DNA_ORIENTATION=+
MESLIGKMDVFMKENSLTGQDMVKEYTLGQMEDDMMEIGEMENNMELEYL